MKSITINNVFRFIDSCSHLPGSLAQLSKDLAADEQHDFRIVKQSGMVCDFMDPHRPLRGNRRLCYARVRPTHVPSIDHKLTNAYSRVPVNVAGAHHDNNMNIERFQIILQGKAFFPYEYCTGFDKLLHCTQMPDRQAFYSHLHESSLSPEDYAYAVQAWTAFNCQSLLEYAYVYNMIDVLLLAELFERYRHTMQSFVGLDPARFITGPSFSYQAMLKFTDVKIEQLTDKRMLNLICENLRGGLSYVSSRYEEATDTPDVNGDVQRILYLDANNLYGSAQSLHLPVRDFEWVPQATILQTDWCALSRTWTGTEDTGYFILCDLLYPEHLHTLHEQFPLAVEKRIITANDLSPEAMHTLFVGEGRKTCKEAKLTATFWPRERYLVHYMVFQTYVRLGLHVTRIREVIRFSQEPFMCKFIAKCTRMRQRAKTKLESNFYKRLVNSIYGSHILNKHNYLQLHVCTHERQIGRYVALPQFHAAKILQQNVVLAFVKHPFVLLDRAYAIGFTILEMSKNMVITTFYDHLQPHFRNLRVITSDTDSILFSYTSHLPSQEDDLKQIAYMLDFSNYDPQHPLYSQAHKNELFFWKNEVPSYRHITRVCALRSKCYSFETASSSQEDQTTTSKIVCKGIPKTGRQQLTIDNYINCIATKLHIMSTFQSIRHKNYELTTMQLKKVALSAFDSKRYMLSCAKHTRPYGSAVLRKLGTHCLICNPPQEQNERNTEKNKQQQSSV